MLHFADNHTGFESYLNNNESMFILCKKISRIQILFRKYKIMIFKQVIVILVISSLFHIELQWKWSNSA